MDKRFIDKLNDLCRQLHDDYLINCGGCCFVAAVLAQNLERYNIAYNVMMCDDYTDYDNDDYDIDNFHYCVDNRLDDDKCIGLREDVCSHYYLKVDDMDINPANVFDYPEVDLGDWLTSEDLFWIYEEGHWNYDFDTDYCDTVADAITQFFDEAFSKRRYYHRSK